MKKVLSAIFVCLLFSSSLTAQHFFSARSEAMGGVGVASARYHAAGFANPALLATFGETDDFAMVIPVAGGIVFDPDNLRDDIDEYQDTFEALEAAFDSGSATAGEILALKNLLTQNLNELDTKSVFANVGGGVSFSFPFFSPQIALVARGYSDVHLSVNVDSGDAALISGATASADLTNLQSNVRAIGAMVSEFGLALGHELDLGACRLALGATVKAQRVDTYNYAINVNNFDDGDYDDSQYRNDDTDFNLDLGVALRPSDGLTIGLRATNVIEHEYDTELIQSMTYSYKVPTVLVGGICFTNETLTLAADVDLKGDDRFENDDETAFVRCGLELNIFDWVQLRGGFRHDMEGNLEDLLTAGVGFSPFSLLRIDITGMVDVEEGSAGGVVQVALTF